MQMNLDSRASRAKRQLSRRHMLIFLFKIQYSDNVILYEEYKFHYILAVVCEHTAIFRYCMSQVLQYGS